MKGRYSALTKTVKSLGALAKLPLGVRECGMWSIVTAVMITSACI